MSNLVTNPYEVLLGLDGRGLNGGQVFIGMPDEDPETNPKAVYWDEDLTDPATQPLDTMGGYIVRSNTPSQAYVSGTYSMLVKDRFGQQVFYIASATGADAMVSGTGLLYIEAEGAAIPEGVTTIRTTGDSEVGVGAAWFSTKLTGSPYARTFTAADERVFEMLASDSGWSVCAYGALSGGDATDNRAAIQEAINHALWLERNGYGTQAVYVDPGKYTIDGPLEIFVQNEDGTYNNVSVTLTSCARGYVSGRATEIRSTNVQLPAVMVAKGRSVNIKNISFFGPCALVQPTYEQLLGSPTAWSNVVWDPETETYVPCMAQTTYAPGCGIVIDPFSNDAEPTHQYPGYADYYTDNNASSSGVIIENCEVQGFYAGVVCSPSLSTQIGDSITIRDCTLSYNTYPVSTCQSQNRAVHVENCRISSCYVVVNTNVMGNRDGDLPRCEGLNVTFARYLFSATATIGSGVISTSNIESTYSLGYWQGIFPLSIRDCHIKLIPPSVVTTQEYVDWHLYNGAPVNFFGGYCGFYSNVSVPLAIVGGGMVAFRGTELDGSPVSARPLLIDYDTVPLRYVNGGYAYGIQETFVAATEALLAQAIDALMPLGGKALFGSGDFGQTVYRNNTGARNEPLETAVVTVDGVGGATFPTATEGKYRLNEWLVTSTSRDIRLPNGTLEPWTYTLIGQVKTVAGGVVTLQCVPETLVGGSLAIVSQELRPFRRRCVATATSGSPILTNVSPADHGFAVGDRVLSGNGIVGGSYITAVDTGANTITLSQDANASGQTKVRNASMYLEDASAFAIPTGVGYQGDFFRNTVPTKDGNNMVLRGWICTADGGPAPATPAVFEPQYDSAVSPAT